MFIRTLLTIDNRVVKNLRIGESNDFLGFSKSDFGRSSHMPDPTQATILFNRAMQETHTLLAQVSPENHLIVVIDLTVNVGERTYSDLRVQISQPYGTHFNEAIEVHPIKGYSGPRLNWDQFKDMCEEYYRKLLSRWIGPKGVIKTNAGLAMRNNWFVCPMERTIDLQEPSSGAW